MNIFIRAMIFFKLVKTTIVLVPEAYNNRGCSIGDDIISHSLSGAIRDIKHQRNL